MVRGSCGAKDPLTPRAQSKSRFEFEQRDTEESKFVDIVDFGDIAFSVETVIHRLCALYCVFVCVFVCIELSNIEKYLVSEH